VGVTRGAARLRKTLYGVPAILHGDYIGWKTYLDIPGKMHEGNGKCLFSAGSERPSGIQLLDARTDRESLRNQSSFIEN
jgi:hypothetical protein